MSVYEYVVRVLLVLIVRSASRRSARNRHPASALLRRSAIGATRRRCLAPSGPETRPTRSLAFVVEHTAHIDPNVYCSQKRKTLPQK